MKEKFEHIDELYHEKMFNYSSPPPEIVWKRIENSIAENKKRALVPFFLKLTAGIVFLAGLTALFIKIMNDKNNKNVLPLASQNIPAINSNIQSAQNSKTFTYNELIAKRTAKKRYHKILPEINSERQVSSSTDPDKNIVANLSFQNSLVNLISQNSLPAEDTSLAVVSDLDIYPKDSTIIVADFKSNKSDSVKVVAPSPNYLVNDLLPDNEPKKQNKLKWTIGGQAGPQYSYRKLTTVNQNNANNINYNNYDSPLLAYAGGIQIEVEPSRRLSIQSGVYYSKIGQEISSINIMYVRNDNFSGANGSNENQPVEVVNSIGNIEYPVEIVTSNLNLVDADKNYNTVSMIASPSAGDYSGQQIFEYVEIPLILRYRVIAQKIGVNLIGGLGTDILVNNSVKLTNSSNVSFETKTDALKTFNYSGTIGFGFDYPLSKKIIFNIEPFFKYYLSPINESSQAKAQPYMIGIMTGLNYSF